MFEDFDSSKKTKAELHFKTSSINIGWHFWYMRMFFYVLKNVWFFHSLSSSVDETTASLY